MILSRAKPAIQTLKDGEGGPGSASTKKQLPKLDEFLGKRDYMGAISLLEFHRNSGQGDEMTDLWLGYCAFHVGDYKRSMLEFEALTHAKKVPKDAYLSLACTYFYLGMILCISSWFLPTSQDAGNRITGGLLNRYSVNTAYSQYTVDTHLLKQYSVDTHLLKQYSVDTLFY
jgi:hypothetical protein